MPPHAYLPRLLGTCLNLAAFTNDVVGLRFMAELGEAALHPQPGGKFDPQDMTLPNSFHSIINSVPNVKTSNRKQDGTMVAK